MQPDRSRSPVCLPTRRLTPARVARPPARAAFTPIRAPRPLVGALHAYPRHCAVRPARCRTPTRAAPRAFPRGAIRWPAQPGLPLAQRCTPVRARRPLARPRLPFHAAPYARSPRPGRPVAQPRRPLAQPCTPARPCVAPARGALHACLRHRAVRRRAVLCVCLRSCVLPSMQARPFACVAISTTLASVWPSQEGVSGFSVRCCVRGRSWPVPVDASGGAGRSGRVRCALSSVPSVPSGPPLACRCGEGGTWRRAVRGFATERDRLEGGVRRRSAGPASRPTSGPIEWRRGAGAVPRAL